MTLSSQITQPLSRSALTEGGVTALMSRAGSVTVTPVTLRSDPVSIPSRQQHSVSLTRHSGPSNLLEDEIGAGDYITLTSSNAGLVFPSLNSSEQQDRGVTVTRCQLSQLFTNVSL